MTDAPETTYDGSIQALLDSCELDWGKPEDNRKTLVPYGMPAIDKALYGLNITDGELVVLQGEEKNRKTTAWMNWVANYMTAGKPVIKPTTVCDMLESSMGPKRTRDTFICNMATRHLFALGHKYKEFCPVCKTNTCRHFGLSPEYLRYNTRTLEQQEAVVWAMLEMRKWPLFIYGASSQMGDTRNIQTSMVGTDTLPSRWDWLIDNRWARIFITDHVQQYSFVGGENSAYDKLDRAVSIHGEKVAKRGIVDILVTQVSLTSLRDAKTTGGKVMARGGSKAAEEANVVFQAFYEQNSSKMTLSIVESRRSGAFPVYQPLEDASGAFYGEATTGKG